MLVKKQKYYIVDVRTSLYNQTKLDSPLRT